MDLVHREDVDPATRAWWDDLCRETTAAMQDHCMRYVTPISHATSHTEGKLQGTGAYVEYAGKRLLITNEHVIRHWRAHQFTHQFFGCEYVFKLERPLALEDDPVDCAICLVDDDIWRSRTHTAEPVPAERIAQKHQPMHGELFFLSGYPGERSGFVFETLFTPATRLVTQELPAHVTIPRLHRNYFTLAYVPGKAESIDPRNAVPLPLPPGLSGSLVWNTRRVECHADGRDWSPEMAQVTGMVCSWIEKPPCVVAIRVEVIRDFLRRRTARPYWWGRLKAFVSRQLRRQLALISLTATRSVATAGRGT